MPLPERLGNSGVVGFGPDGRAVCIKTGDEIIRVEFNPLRQTVVPGSSGLGAISSVTIAGSGHIFVSGTARGRCGLVAPDGRRAVRHELGHLLITDLGTGKSRTISGFESKGAFEEITWLGKISWSPDGRWISVVGEDGQIVLIDSGDPQRRRHVGSSSGGPVSWSPDSKYLLVLRSELRCSLYLYSSSLAAVDVGLDPSIAQRPGPITP
jgi:WD40 repeat protein